MPTESEIENYLSCQRECGIVPCDRNCIFADPSMDEFMSARDTAEWNQVAVPAPVDKVGPAGPHGTDTEEATRS